MYKPSWFLKGEVLIVNAKTCGINKDGKEQYIVNQNTGVRSNGEIDDSLAECCDNISNGDFSRGEIFYHDYNDMVSKDVYIPKYYDFSLESGIENLVKKNSDFTLMSLGELINNGSITIFGGHGSPSSDQRLGDVPYIKVSDLRAGHVNINPTNMIPLELAKQFWGADSSGMQAYDLISPERASKNIGEFCILMPGQERIILTKEVIVIRASNSSLFDHFYLQWALSLHEVRRQWERVIFMQTNREDVGKRALEIKIPVPTNKSIADKYAKPFKEYYISLEDSRRKFIQRLEESAFRHHIYLGD